MPGPVLGSGMGTYLLQELSLQVGDNAALQTRWCTVVCSQESERWASKEDLTGRWERADPRGLLEGQ